MNSIAVLNSENKKVKEIDFLPTVSLGKASLAVVQQAVINRLANERKGTASTKGRAEVNFSTVKLFRQKGTGRARAGSRKSPVRVGGGTVFGPKPRDYSYNISKKSRKRAVCTVISEKYKGGDILVVEDINLGEIKTKALRKMLDGFGLNTSAIILLGEKDDMLKKSARNLSDITVLNIQNINAYDLLTHKKLIIKEKDLVHLEEMLG